MTERGDLEVRKATGNGSHAGDQGSEHVRGRKV